MQVFQGKSASGGVATGKIFLYQKGEQQVKRLHVEDTEAELARLREAAKEAAEQLQKTLRSVREVHRRIRCRHL